MPRGEKRFGSLPSSSRHAFVEAHLVLVVVDRERRAVAEPLGLAAQDAAARGVEGEDPDRARGAAEHRLEALAHLPRGLVREGDRENLVRLHLHVDDQVSDAIREDTRLPRARSGDDEQRSLGVQDRLALGLVEVCEGALGGRDRDPSMLAVAAEPARGGYQLMEGTVSSKNTFPGPRRRAPSTRRRARGRRRSRRAARSNGTER